MKKGFTPLEIIFALAISVLLTTMLSQALWQLNKTLEQVTRVASFDIRTTVLLNLLGKEIGGAHVPRLVPMPQEKKEQKQLTPSKISDKETQKTEQEDAIPPKAFYSQNNANGTVKMLTFITSNPLTAYNTTKPLLARVMYTLVPNKERPETFDLYRQEGPDVIDLKKFTGNSSDRVKGFVVIEGVKEIAFEFYALPIANEKLQQKKAKADTKQKESAQKNPEGEQQAQEVIKLTQWDSDKNYKEMQEGKQLVTPLVPGHIKMTLTLLDQRERERSVEWAFIPLSGEQPIVIQERKPFYQKENEDKEHDLLDNIIKKQSPDLIDRVSKKFEEASKITSSARGSVTGAMK